MGAQHRALPAVEGWLGSEGEPGNRWLWLISPARCAAVEEFEYCNRVSEHPLAHSAGDAAPAGRWAGAARAVGGFLAGAVGWALPENVTPKGRRCCGAGEAAGCAAGAAGLGAADCCCA